MAGVCCTGFCEGVGFFKLLRLFGGPPGVWYNVFMKLYKLVAVHGCQAASIFAPRSSTVRGDPDDVMVRYDAAYRVTFLNVMNMLKGIGFTDKQAVTLVAFWFTYARNTLGLRLGAAHGYVLSQTQGLVAQYAATAPAIAVGYFWPLVLVGIALVAVAGGLYVWVQLDTLDHFQHLVNDYAYVLRLGEEMRECELAYVGPDDRGIYEEGGTWGPVITSVDPDVPILGGTYDMFHFFGGIRLRRRWAVIHYVWRWYYWVVKYIGDVYRVEHKLYRLKKPTLDPYAPPGVWTRPGTSYGTTGYLGPWNYYWLKPH